MVVQVCPSQYQRLLFVISLSCHSSSIAFDVVFEARQSACLIDIFQRWLEKAIEAHSDETHGLAPIHETEEVEVSSGAHRTHTPGQEGEV